MLTCMTNMLHILTKAAMPAPSLLALSRKRERGTETRCASFTSMQSGQRGMSLIELMIALTMGLFLLLGLSTFLTTTLKSNTAAVRLASLDQELRAIMTLMARDVRRAGYWGSPDMPISGVYPTGALSMIGKGSTAYTAGTGTTFAAMSGVAGLLDPLPAASRTTTTGCILYSYDGPNNATAASVIYPAASSIFPNGNGLQDTNEHFGFFLSSDGVVMMSTGGATTCPAITATAATAATAGWDYLSDRGNTKITALSFTETSSVPVYLNGAPGPNVQTRQVLITITGQPISDPGIAQTLTETVKIENDLFSPN